MMFFRRNTPSAVVLFLLFSPWVHAANSYVQIRANRANIRSAPTTSATLVVTVRKGDVFELLSEEREWYQVRLFAGGTRYVHKSLAEKVPFKVETPDDVSIRQEIFQAFEAADERVRTETNARYPAEKDLGRNIRQVRLLQDRYRMQVIWKFQTRAPVYRSIMIEGARKGW